MKRKILLVTILSGVLFLLPGCASCERARIDIKSDLRNGLYRTIKIYTADGQIIAEYEGKIDIEASTGGYVKFDFDGKRYIYYNCFVESIADID